MPRSDAAFTSENLTEESRRLVEDFEREVDLKTAHLKSSDSAFVSPIEYKMSTGPEPTSGLWTEEIPVGKDVTADDISVSLKGRILTLHVKVTEPSGAFREFGKMLTVPQNVNLRELSSVLTATGNLRLQAPYQQPQSPASSTKTTKKSTTTTTKSTTSNINRNDSNVSVDSNSSGTSSPSINSQRGVQQQQRQQTQQQQQQTQNLTQTQVRNQTQTQTQNQTEIRNQREIRNQTQTQTNIQNQNTQNQNNLNQITNQNQNRNQTGGNNNRQTTTTTTSTKTTTTETTITTRTIAVELHNTYRKIHDSGSVKLSEKLCEQAEKYAQALVDGQQAEHEQGLGRNIFQVQTSGPGATAVPPAEAVKEAVNAWYSHSKEYNYNDPLSSSRLAKLFSQLVWKSSDTIGVGTASSGGLTVVCVLYHKAGNIMSNEAYRENVLKPTK